jgi:hypothetical protein
MTDNVSSSDYSFDSTIQNAEKLDTVISNPL